MKKRILCVLLALAMLLPALPQLTPKAKAHEIVMTADEFIECLWTAYNRPNVYRNSYPYNLGYYDGSVIYFDCWNLGKAIIWSKGEIVNNYTVGRHASMDISCGLDDWDGLTIIKEAPNCSTDFSELVPGEWLYMDNHTGYYVGDGQVIECTAGWNVWGITISQIDSNGYRSRNGVPNGKWVYHGMVPWLDYSSVGKQETWVEKAAFDVMVYRDRNPDISHMTDDQLKKHWLNYGIKEGRASSTVLDLGFYVNNNADVKAAFTKNGVTDFEAVYNHFITSGYKERRKSSALFDGAYYCQRYPEIADSFKDEYMRHYVQDGMAEGRRASLTFDPDYYWYILPDVYKTWPNDYTMCARHYAGHGINAQIQAYDHEAPVISDVKITDISADGYTVCCTVTDDWDIKSVAFPTWTVRNNQDDLPADFMTTQLGTRSGNTFTFRVKSSAHNNETGQYITHIYATDKGGNQVQLVLDTVEVKDIPQELTLLPNSRLILTDSYLTNVATNTSVDTVLEQFSNYNLQIVNCGEVISGSDIIGTGSQIQLYDGNTLIDSVTIVVLGDVDGNGGIDSTDYLNIKASLLGEQSFTTYQALAADVDENGSIDTTDYLRIRAHFLGGYNMYD